MKKVKHTKPRRPSRKVKNYPVQILAIVLLAMLLLEGAFFMNTSRQDWKAGLSVLDVSSGMTSMKSDVEFILQPFLQAYQSVDQFYEAAATAMTQLLDPAGDPYPPAAIASGVNSFYAQATEAMTQVLDISNYSSNLTPQVAGISITR